MTRCSLLHLGSDAGRALVKDGIMVLESRDTGDVLVSVIQIVIATMAKALMPEEAISTNREPMEK
jgi:hypothetical protein